MFPTNKPIQDTSPPVPTLSLKGWVKGMYNKIDLIFTYYLTSQYSQTTYHHGHVKSLQYSVQQYYTQPSALAQRIKDDIEYLMKEVVDYCDVNVTYSQRGDTHYVDYRIIVDIVHQGYKWDVKRAIEVKDGLFKEIIEINRTGYSLS